MPVLQNQEAWILGEDGESFEEYDVKVEENVVTCYIESELNKVFSMHWKNHDNPTKTSTNVKFYVDGFRMSSSARKKSIANHRVDSKGFRLDHSSYKPYKFSNITLCEDDDQVDSSNAELGSLSIEVYRVTVAGRHPLSNGPRLLPQGFASGINEKNKKICAQQVALGDVTRDDVTLVPAWKTKPYKKEKGPFVKFIFLYRPRDVLRALDVLPAPILGLGGSNYNRNVSAIAGSSKSVRMTGERRKRAMSPSETKEEEALLERENELQRELEEIRKKRRTSGKATKVKKEEPIEIDLTLDENCAIDLTLSD